jgi:bacteriocin-like protein
MSKTKATKPPRELTKDELSLVSGGAVNEAKAEAQIFQALSSAISEVMKNFGAALNTAARGG